MPSDDAAAATAEIQKMIDSLMALERAPEEMAPVVAKSLDKFLRKQISTGQAPDGTAWPARKDGGKPLQNAGAALRVSVHGPVVVAQLTGPTAMHHLGRGRGGVRRQILPDGIPQAVVKVLQEALTQLAKPK